LDFFVSATTRTQHADALVPHILIFPLILRDSFYTPRFHTTGEELGQDWSHEGEPIDDDIVGRNLLHRLTSLGILLLVLVGLSRTVRHGGKLAGENPKSYL
jgi:hypothetical protein